MKPSEYLDYSAEGLPELLHTLWLSLVNSPSCAILLSHTSICVHPFCKQLCDKSSTSKLIFLFLHFTAGSPARLILASIEINVRQTPHPNVNG